ncbi:MAG: dihydrodipicolinate synthase family protein [Verrucomicrobiales bacterium]|nr:dihydrodipicolinate synthase family protein [Verrucomicrobiales bacterium]
MKRSPVGPEDLRGVIAVPPLPRHADASRTPNFGEADRLVRHLNAAGITRFMFGGNAFFYHVTLHDYAAALDWMSGLPDDWWVLPSAGPSYGRLMDQASLLRSRRFPAVMLLPCTDPRDAAGMDRGVREFVEAAATPVILYLKAEDTLGADRPQGIEVAGRWVDEGICVGIKYAVVREDPAADPYLERLLARVDRSRVASGIGERPAVVHLNQWRLPGFTTGSGCVAPRLTQRLFSLAAAGRWDEAEEVRRKFLALEDLRDAWNPAKVLHHAVALAGVAETGPLCPFLSALSAEQQGRIEVAARALVQEA